MSKAKSPKKRVVKTDRPDDSARTPARPRRTADRPAAASGRELTFGRDTYIWMGIGFGLVLLGMLLMSGGRITDPDVWDPDVIYSARRILIAPIVILLGLGTVGYAIFKK